MTVEIKSPTAGVISKFHVKEGDNLDVGKPFFDVDPEGQKKQGETKADQPQTKKPEPKQEQKQ